MQHREWYCTQPQWVSNFGTLAVDNGDGMGKSSEVSDGNFNTVGGKDTGVQSGALAEEMIVPADEHFTRCPVSNEAFIPEWDDEEGDYMYKNAVKVLVSAASDEALYEHSQPTSSSHLRYAIVHQLLVMDGWLFNGKAITVKDASERLRKCRPDADEKSCLAVEKVLLSAMEEEDDEEDVFLLLDGNGEIPPNLFENVNDSQNNTEESLDV